MADPIRPSLRPAADASGSDGPSLEALSELGRSEGLRKVRWLPASLRAMALGEALPWLEGNDRMRAAAWLVRRAAHGDRLAGIASLATKAGHLVFGGTSVPASQEALFQLTRNWQALPESLRGRALDAAGPARWLRALDRAARMDDPRARASAAELAGLVGGRLGSLQALRLAGPMLADEDRGVAMAAERALVRATGRAAEIDLASLHAREGDAEPDLGDLPAEVATVQGVEEVIAQAVIHFDEHRRFGVLLAALAILTEASASAGRRGIGSPLANWLATRPSNARGGNAGAHGALRTVLRKADLPLARQRALSWIVVDHLAQAAGDRLSRANTPAEHEAVLHRAFLTRRRLRASRVAGMQARPRMRQAVGQAVGEVEPKQPDIDASTTPPIDWPEACPVPGETTIERLDARARAGLAEWMAALQLDRQVRARVLTPRLNDDDARVRYSLTRFAPPTIIEDLAYDADGSVARSAVLNLSRLGEPLEAVPAATQPVDAWMAALDRHPDEVVRMIGQQELARAGKRGADALAACSARAALKRTDARGKWLLVALESEDPARQIEAMTLARRLRLPAKHEGVRDALLAAVMIAGPASGLAEDDERQRVAASAVRALSIAPGREVSKAIEAACRYPAARVRANAVEAIDDRRRRGLIEAPADRFVELTGDEHQRVRANAVRAGLIGVERKPDRAARQASEAALRTMLGDERAAHRVSGLWVASRVLRRGPELSLGRRWTELAAVIADMARHDADPGARARAAACLGSLEAEARQRWQRGASRTGNGKRQKGAVA
ncbi:MAG: hypothetical protein RIE77_01195 [Phycisphaerales bacterium]|jgi:hypothetical protein